MQQSFYSISLLCILYYVGILWYTKNRSATFSSFWLVFGLVQIPLGFLVGKLPAKIVFGIQIVCGIALILFLAVEIVILSGMLTVPSEKLPVIIVLGACIRGRKITGALRRRLDKAATYLKENPETLVIVSGGQGKGEDVTEAFAMREYLIQRGIEEKRIRMEEKSRTTRENLAFSRQLLKRNENEVGIVTNNFHMYRAIKLAKLEGYKEVRGIVAGCDSVLFLNYMVREFFAILQLYLKNFMHHKKLNHEKELIDK